MTIKIQIGIGSLNHLNGASYLNLCQAGRLQLNHDIFKGHHTQLMIPSEGPMPARIKQNESGKFSMPKNRHYEVMLANCHERGRRIHVRGQVVFDLVDGEAPVTNLTATSLTILVSVAFTVFALLTILAIRINWGTRADFEYEQYGLLPGNDGELESPTDDSVGTENEVGDDQFEDEDGTAEVVEHTIVTQTTIVYY